jgi:ubiquitin-like 1-activating enzyme E1 A
MQAQQKIQAANILLISMKALANEIAKNLVLAGIGSLTIVDDKPVKEADLGAQFFLSQENVGQNRAEAAAVHVQKLNPRVKVFPDSGSIMEKGASYFAAFDIVIATDLNPTLLAFINTATRLHNRQFYAAGVHGIYGYLFCDLIEHDYILKRDKGNVVTTVGPESRFRSVIEVKTQKEGNKTIEMVSKRDFYSTWDLVSETSLLSQEYTKSKRRLKAVSPALSCLRALWQFQAHYNREPGHNKPDLEWFTKSATHNHYLLSLPQETLRSEFLRSFLQNINSEIAPVTAILGGQLAQDVINVLGQNQQPIQNMVIFDGNKMEANMYPLHPEGNLGRTQLDFGSSLPMGHVQVDLSQGAVDMSQMMPMRPSNTMMPPDTM